MNHNYEWWSQDNLHKIKVFKILLLLLALAMNRKRQKQKKKKKVFFYIGQKKISNLAQTNSQRQRFKNFRGHLLSAHSFLATLKSGYTSIWRQVIRISSCSSSRPAQACSAHCICQTATRQTYRANACHFLCSPVTCQALLPSLGWQTEEVCM